jgi:hypothetical protein
MIIEVNRKLVNHGRTGIRETVEWNAGKMTRGKEIVNVPTWKFDGYKCVICGVEYEQYGDDSGSVESRLPGKLVVETHLNECTVANRQTIRDEGRLCCN